MSTPSPDQVPGPPAEPRALSYDEIAQALTRMRAEAGNPSYADVVVRIARRRAEAGDRSRPGRTTVYDAFRPGRSRLNAGLVAEIVVALTGDEALAAHWSRACVRAQAARERGAADAQPAAPTRDPADVAPVARERTASAATPPEPAAPDPAVASPADPHPADLDADSHRARPLSLRGAALLVALAVVVNMVGMVLTRAMALPLYLDMIGTALAAMVLGPAVGALTGVLSNVAGVGVNGVDSVPFALVQVAGALVWGVGVRRGWARSVDRLLALNVAVALVCTLVAAPVVGVYLRGDLLNPSHPLSARLVELTGAFAPSIVAANLFYSLVDKLLAGFVVAALVLRVPRLRAVGAHLLDAEPGPAPGTPAAAGAPAQTSAGRPPERDRPAVG